MHEIFELFSAQITTGLAAVSNQDFEFWKSPESKAYLDHNAKLAKAGRNVDRLFVVADGRPLSADEWTILETQIKSGIGVRVTRHGMANAVSNGQPLDFALLDDFGVTFWKGSYIRAFELALDRETVAKFKTHRDLLVGSAINDTNGQSFTDAAKLRIALQGNGLM